MTLEKSNNTLLSRLLRAVPDAAASLERVPLTPGAWPLEGTDSNAHVYFPEEGLVSLWRPGPQGAATVLAVAGRHSCLLPGYWQPGPFQAHVLVPGHAHRFNWSLVQSDSQRYADWLLETAKASQQLIRQVAQMTYCVQHHGVAQRMASWLLICLNQNPQPSLQIQLAELKHWLCVSPEQFQSALVTLQAHAVIRLESPSSADLLPEHEAMASTLLHTSAPARLEQLACSCHLQVQGGDSAQAHDGP